MIYQKRYAKFPTLVMPNSRISLPVNCAEQGQPSIRGDYGGHTTIVPPSLRSGDVDQNTAWSRINNTQLILGRMNPTRSYCFTDRTADVDDYLDAIGKRPREGQVGIIAGIKSGDKTYFYTDFFGNHSILADTYSKLAKCFGIVARVHEGNADDIKLDDLVGFFRKFEVVEGHREPHVGGGELYLLKNQEDGAVLTGTVLSYKTAPVQVTMREKVGQD